MIQTVRNGHAGLRRLLSISHVTTLFRSEVKMSAKHHTEIT